MDVYTLRASAFPPIKELQQLANRFNLSTSTAVLAFLGATRLGVAPGLASLVVPGTDYSQGYVGASLLKAPPVHSARDELSAAFREAAPPGSIWWTDVSNTRPEDFDGNVVSRLFSEERTGYAITYYSPRKDSATLVEQIAELASWVAANVPGGELRVHSLRLRRRGGPPGPWRRHLHGGGQSVLRRQPADPRDAGRPPLPGP